MKDLCKLLTFMSLLVLSFNVQAAEEKLLNEGWHFVLKDVPQAKEKFFDDSAWRILNLPHDWAFEQGYSADGAQKDKGGYACGGVGWYRKAIKLDKKSVAEGKRLFLAFDAAYMNSEVWINGHYLGKRPYGYISFEYEITPYVIDGENMVSVRIDNSLEPSARWYHGCGIYGNVYLKITNAVRLATGSVFVTTPMVTSEKAVVKVICKPDMLKEYKKVSVDYIILSPVGKKVGLLKNVVLNQKKAVQEITVDKPQLWDIDTPHLYSLVTKLKIDGEVVDETVTCFGIRHVEWRTETGFWLNGKNVKLRGVCEHLEGGPVGAAWTENLIRWKVKLLKEMGCNSIRTAHNPQLPVFYDICDEEGMLVMDEVFDGWRTKAPFDYGNQAFAGWWERDLRDWVRRDRNHPSVIIYSVGNETRGDVASELVKVCHEEDDTRLVTSGHSGSDFMDILGVNGHSEKKSFILNYKPGKKAFVGTETPHTWQVRGYYRTQTWYRDGYPNKRQDPFEIPDLCETEIFNYDWASASKWTNRKQHFNSSYDNAVVRINARQNMAYLRDLPWYSGSYRWTGFDYLGEAGYVHGGWPFRAFMGGVLDMAGFKKDHFYLYQSEWTSSPMVHLLPHWTHPDMKRGTKVPVQTYTTGEEVELFFNGRSLGKQRKGTKWEDMACTWMVPWEPGVVEAVSYRNGEEIARTSQKTVFVPEKLGIWKEESCLTGKRDDLHVITIAQQSTDGTLYPYGENRVYFHLKGKAKVFSAENGNPVDVEANWNAKSKCAFGGLLRTFVRCDGDKKAVLHAGAILGDKRLKMSSEVGIDVCAIEVLSGELKSGVKYDIYYTVDGTEPFVGTIKYTKPFAVKDGMTVKAVVFLKGVELFRMEEKFGKEEGIYWSDGSESKTESRGIQAEMCESKGMKELAIAVGFEGKSYLSTTADRASLSFYQENDGSNQNVSFVVAFMPMTENAILRVFNNGKEVGKRVLKTGEQDIAKWQEVTFKIPFYSGANQIEVVVEGEPGNAIDWVDLVE